MHAQTKKLREAVKHIPHAWVRRWPTSGEVWAGTHERIGRRAAMLEVKGALEKAGFHCECNGKPNTAGEFIIDIHINH